MRTRFLTIVMSVVLPLAMICLLSGCQVHGALGPEHIDRPPPTPAPGEGVGTPPAAPAAGQIDRSRQVDRPGHIPVDARGRDVQEDALPPPAQREPAPSPPIEPVPQPEPAPEPQPMPEPVPEPQPRQ